MPKFVTITTANLRLADTNEKMLLPVADAVGFFKGDDIDVEDTGGYGFTGFITRWIDTTLVQVRVKKWKKGKVVAVGAVVTRL